MRESEEALVGVENLTLTDISAVVPAEVEPLKDHQGGQKQRPRIHSNKSVASTDGRKKVTLSRRFPAILTYIFIGVGFLMLPVFLAQIILLATGNSLLQNVGVYIFNLLATACIVFGFAFTVCWAPTVQVFFVGSAVFLFNAALQTVWVYYSLGLTATLLWIVADLAPLHALTSVAHAFPVLAAQPFNPAMETWLGIFKLFIIVTIPLVSNFIRNNAASTVAFYSVVVFTFTAAIFGIAIRGDFSLHPKSQTVGMLINRISARRMFSSYIPIVGLGTVFIVLYVLAVSGADQFSWYSETIPSSVLAFGIPCVFWYVLCSFASYRGSHVAFMRAIASFSHEDLEFLRARTVGNESS